jgi:hypothetical protein
MPTQKYAKAPEILEHAAHRPSLRSCTTTRCSRPRSPSCAGTTPRRWHHRPPTAATRLRARFVVMANGPLNRPKLPGIPGIDDFKGHTFHTSRWDYATPAATPRAASPAWPTSASASSAPAPPPCSACRTSARRQGAVRVPAHAVVGRRARQPPTDPDWVASLQPGWQRERMENFNNLVISAAELREDLVNDGWTDIIGNICSCAPQAADGSDPARAYRPDDAGAAGRLREDGARSAPGSTPIVKTRHRRGAEALVPPVLQAAVLPRRVPAHVQPAQRAPDRHRRQGRRADHRAGVVVPTASNTSSTA